MADKTLDGITRRDFLKYAVILGAGVCVGLNPFKAYGKEINGVYVDDTTVWTPEKFRNEVIHSDKKSLVYWRMEGVGPNKEGDRMMGDLCMDLKIYLDNFYQINLEKYSRKEGMSLAKVLDEVNPDLTDKFKVPNWSVFDKGKENRIRGPPSIYNEYKEIMLPKVITWLNK